MSDNHLKLIPIDPQFTPEPLAAASAERHLRTLLPDVDSVESRITTEATFIDAGGNFESCSCPLCGAEVDLEWWSESMSLAHQARFTDLSVTMPCCSGGTSLNDLRYEWAMGFARFVLEALNPGIAQLPEGAIAELERIIGCGLRLVWAHY